MKKIIVAAAVALIAITIAGPASAHVTATPNEGPAGGFFKTSFRVGHGCEGKPTTKISMQVPGNVTSVHPQVVAGWDIDTKMGKLDEPIEGEGGETITEGVREITWTATDDGLPDAFMQEFGVSMALPHGEAGEPLWFPFVQECPGGDSHDWIEIPESVDAWGELEAPAPYVVLTEAEGDDQGADAEEAATDGGPMSEQRIRTIAAEEASDNDSNILIAWLGVILGAIGVAFGITANMRARKAMK
jgi:periplasmic copper chaperone A